MFDYFKQIVEQNIVVVVIGFLVIAYKIASAIGSKYWQAVEFVVGHKDVLVTEKKLLECKAEAEKGFEKVASELKAEFNAVCTRLETRLDEMNKQSEHRSEALNRRIDGLRDKQ